ncbi:MAG: hypothetical protein OXF88_00605 [Rhodobacteraceae bacterium]|nr:hypothetical protein [Paracoccaceae bacterium]MCY4137490.1 hypothetical protein [Paracoccaceae bacterium]
MNQVPTPTFEQLKSEIGFECRKGTAYRRLRQRKKLGRCRRRSCADNRLVCLELPDAEILHVLHLNAVTPIEDNRLGAMLKSPHILEAPVFFAVTRGSRTIRW